jgi:ApaG protein
MRTMSNPHDIHVSVAARFLDEHSAPQDQRFAFAYTITIRNEGSVPAQLVSRHWVITHGNGKIEEVRGPGVVGEQPHLDPGQAFEYTSGAIIETPVGTMQGSYHMIADDGTTFDALIPRFTLSIPRTLH